MQLQDLKDLKDILDERWQVEENYLARKTLLDDMIRVSKEIVKLLEVTKCVDHQLSNVKDIVKI